MKETLSSDATWSAAWKNPVFSRKAIIGLAIFIAILAFLPHFFALIELRDGYVMEDVLLTLLPPKDLSIAIFILIWSATLWVLYRSIQRPDIFLKLLYSLIVLCFVRILCIYLVPLNPPDGLIRLTDPLTSLTYGGKDIFITKDLFFSGHTSNVFMFCLCLDRKGEKLVMLMASIAVAAMVLIQHVHYTIDIIAAFAFSYVLVEKIGKRLAAF